MIRHCFILSLLKLKTIRTEGCLTDYGRGLPCHFPYKLEGQIYFSCTTKALNSDSFTKLPPHCPTNVDNIVESAGTFHLTADKSVARGASGAIIATYDFQKADDKLAATKRAKVTTTSDTNGEWIDITEIDSIGGETSTTNSKYFVGRVAFDTNASSGAAGTTCSRLVTPANGGNQAAANVPCADKIDMVFACVVFVRPRCQQGESRRGVL